MNSTIVHIGFDLASMFSDPLVSIDLACVLLTVTAMVVYHVGLHFTQKKNPGKCIKSYRSQLRRVWVNRMLKDEKNYIVVVQTTSMLFPLTLTRHRK
jgi:hypothetical protein